MSFEGIAKAYVFGGTSQVGNRSSSGSCRACAVLHIVAEASVTSIMKPLFACVISKICSHLKLDTHTISAPKKVSHEAKQDASSTEDRQIEREREREGGREKVRKCGIPVFNHFRRDRLPDLLEGSDSFTGSTGSAIAAVTPFIHGQDDVVAYREP